jgi:hypothetical protein
MNVFLSWSGETSKAVASALSKWLPYILQPIHPSLSTEITKGERWGDVLEAELKDAEYGIICLTKYNVSTPWLNFESGVLSRFIDQACLSPFLFNVDPAELTGPLSRFQSTLYRRDEVLRLILSINERLGPASIDDAVVKDAFSVWWEHLEKELNSISPNPQEETTTEYEWLYTFKDLAIHEEKKDIKAIWVITDDLVKHAAKYEVYRKLKANIDNGVAYRFFIPAGTTPTELQELMDYAHNRPGKLEYRSFPISDFYFHAATDYIVVNPDRQGGPLRMFFRLPISSESGEDLWVKTDETSAIKFRNRFDKYWNDYQSISRGVAG